jgi:hypothetical protein
LNRYEVRIGADDSVDGLHVIKLKAGNGRGGMAVLLKTFRESLEGIAEEQLRRSDGELHTFRLKPGPGENEYLIEFQDRNGDVVRVRRLWLEKRIVA